MKKMTIFLLCIFLTGCGKNNDAINQGLELRSNLNNGQGCCFDSVVTADYGDQTYTFAMDCQFDAHGNLLFTVEAPTSIAGISGTIASSGGALTFDDVALSFPLLVDEQFSPISAPWIVIKALKEGYITSAGWADNTLRLVIDDRYEDDACNVHIWMDKNNHPTLAEIYQNDRCILTIEIMDFRML